MATWGKKEIQICPYRPETNKLYYDYNTTCDLYYIKINRDEDYGLGYEQSESEYRFNPAEGQGLMEALINHILAFNYSGDERLFIERFITNNKFKILTSQDKK